MDIHLITRRVYIINFEKIAYHQLVELYIIIAKVYNLRLMRYTDFVGDDMQLSADDIPLLNSFAMDKKIRTINYRSYFFGDPTEVRTRVTAVKGRCLDHLTIGPY